MKTKNQTKEILHYTNEQGHADVVHGPTYTAAQTAQITAQTVPTAAQTAQPRRVLPQQSQPLVDL